MAITREEGERYRRNFEEALQVQFESVLGHIGWLTELEEADNAMLYGRCPLHRGEEKSFTLNRKEQTFQCDSCGSSGDIINFVGAYFNIRAFGLSSEVIPWLLEFSREGKGRR